MRLEEHGLRSQIHLASPTLCHQQRPDNAQAGPVEESQVCCLFSTFSNQKYSILRITHGSSIHSCQG